MTEATAGPSTMERSTDEVGELRPFTIALILAAHGVYGLLLPRSPAIATLHALATMGVGLWVAMTGSMKRVALFGAYIAGFEIIWRLGHALLPWEVAKYAIVLLAAVSLFRVKNLKWDWLAVFYFGLLIPSALLSFAQQDFEFARQQVSFNLSGPLALAVTTWFFSCIRMTRADLQRLLVVALAPIASLVMIALTHTASFEDLAFSDASNFQTSAGYGPNQVSALLGFGVVAAVLLALLVERNVRARIGFAIIGLICGVQSALTFSRGGLAGAFGALVLASPFLLRGARNRMVLAVSAVVLVGAVEVVILPRLEAFTGGALSTRFQDPSTTGRAELVQLELETFSEHPFFGTGPAAFDKTEYGARSVHTEFTRLLSQHGSFGVVALICMVLLAWRAIARQPSVAGRAIAVALLAWSALTMSHAAMRIAIVPFAFGLASASFLAPSSARRGRQFGNATRATP